MAGLLSGLFGGAKPPPPIDVAKTAADTTAANQGAATWNAGQYTANAGQSGPAGGMHFDPTTGSFVRTFAPGSGFDAGFTNEGGALGAQTANPTTGFNFDTTTAPNILDSGMQTYDQYAAAPIAQGQNQINTTLSERGIPLDSKIQQDMQGNFDTANAKARQGAFSSLYASLPGMQGQLIQNEGTKGLLPGQLATQTTNNLGLLQGLLPNYAAPAQYNAAAPDIQGLTQANYTGAMDAYKTNQQSNSALLNTLGTFGGLALGGGAGAGLLSGAKSLFGYGGTSGGSGGSK